MLKTKVVELLNQQVSLEDYSANLYLAMSSWCISQKFIGCARFLEAHSDDEHTHMRKLFNYINETGSMAIVSEVAKPKMDFKSIRDVFEKTLEHEKLITQKINELADTCLGAKDYSTFNFLQWYVSEQHEEEHLFKGILDMMDIMGLDGRGLFMVDREIGKLANRP